MLTYLAILIIYLYGGDVQVKAVQVPSQEACAAVLAPAKAEALKHEEVRDARGVCMSFQVPASRDKV